MKQTEPYHIEIGNLNKYNEHYGGGYYVTEQDLEKWAEDPNCIERELCADALIKRREDIEAQRQAAKASRQAAEDAKRRGLSERRQKLEANPFDPRTEISADAKHIASHIASRIVTHLWILFVLLPIILGLLYALLTAR